MKTREQFIAELKLAYPSIQIGGGDFYETLSATDYEARIGEWADIELAKQAEVEAAEQAKTDKAAAEAKLAALGLTADDLKALGL
jgi:hypothetical protein